MGMGIVGEQFIDYGNTLECTEPVIQGYEVLSNGMVRLFVCKKFGGQVILDHTDIASTDTLLTLSQRLCEIALATQATTVPSATPPPLLAPLKAH